MVWFDVAAFAMWLVGLIAKVFLVLFVAPFAILFVAAAYAIGSVLAGTALGVVLAVLVLAGLGAGLAWYSEAAAPVVEDEVWWT